jgi:hypothetical protein
VPDVVVVSEPSTPEPEQADQAAAEAVGEAAAATAAAVGEGIAAGVSAVAAEHLAESAETDARLAEISEHLAAQDAAIAALAEQPEPEVIAAEVDSEPTDDEIVPMRSHPWFRSRSEWFAR